MWGHSSKCLGAGGDMQGWQRTCLDAGGDMQGARGALAASP